VAPNQQAQTLLVLPNMSQFVNEKGLQTVPRGAEIGAPQIPAGMKPEMSIWRHRHVSRLKRKPFSPMDADRIDVQGCAKDLRRKRALSLCQWATGIAPKPAH